MVEEARKKGRTIKRIRNKGPQEHDVWTHLRDKKMDYLPPRSQEHVGFPTQKPLSLMQRIIETSTSEGDMVLDPFCGCATTLVAAEHFGRRWCGIDLSPKAAELVVQRIGQSDSDVISTFEGFRHAADIPIRHGHRT